MKVTISTASEAAATERLVGVALNAPTQRHHCWLSCLRGKHGGGLQSRR